MRKSNYIIRILDITKDLELQPQFLFGARLTGKTSYLTMQMQDMFSLHIDLLNSNERTMLERNPKVLSERVRALDKEKGLIVIDEIQLVPSLLYEVHKLIESTDFTFLMTGSGVRKLKHAGVDLLGGRAGEIIFHPLVWPEIKDREYSLEHIFKTGLLPRMYLSRNADRLLLSYKNSYILTQVQIEGAIRNIPSFSSFLTLAALSSGEQINFSNIANDTGVSANTIRAWYDILTDMLLGYEIPAYTATKKRKATVISKYYLFDVGVIRSILGSAPPTENTSEYGKFFEHYICHELVSYIDYNGGDSKDRGLCYWRTSTGLEVDFIYKNQVAIETKTTTHVNERGDLKGLRAFREEGLCRKAIIVSRDEFKRKTEDGIYIYPYKVFLDELWRGQILEVK